MVLFYYTLRTGAYSYYPVNQFGKRIIKTDH